MSPLCYVAGAFVLLLKGGLFVDFDSYVGFELLLDGGVEHGHCHEVDDVAHGGVDDMQRREVLVAGTDTDYLFGDFSEEEERRLMLRSEMKKHNTRLASAAKESGVLTNKDYGIFQNAGYKGLYGGLDQDDNT